MDVIYRVYGDLTLNGETGRFWYLQTKDLKYAIDKLNRLTLQGHRNLEIKSKEINRGEDFFAPHSFDAELERTPPDDWI